MGFQICSDKEAGPFWGPIRGKMRTLLTNLQKSSSYALLAGMHCHLAWNILGERRFKFFQMKYLGSYREILKTLLLNNCCTKWDFSTGHP